MRNNPGIEWASTEGVEQKLNRIVRAGQRAEKDLDLAFCGNLAYELQEVIRKIDWLHARATKRSN